MKVIEKSAHLLRHVVPVGREAREDPDGVRGRPHGHDLDILALFSGRVRARGTDEVITAGRRRRRLLSPS